VNNSANKYGQALLVVMIFFVSESLLTKAQDKKPVCQAPVKWLVPPKFTEGDIAKWKDRAITGTVSLLVSEGGDVIEGRVQSVKPKEAASAFLSAVKQGKFQPRPGCGDWKTEVTFIFVQSRAASARQIGNQVKSWYGFRKPQQSTGPNLLIQKGRCRPLCGFRKQMFLCLVASDHQLT